ncbi:MAG: ABC transporter substrate-binding protein [Oscillospiraceae bacterium]
MKGVTKILSLVLAIVMIVGVLAGCGKQEQQGSSTPATPAPDTSEPVETTPDSTAPEEMIPLPTSGQNVVQTAVPLIAGEQMGIWEKYGLDITRTHYVSGPPQLEAQPSGDWQIGWIGAPAAITGILSYNMKVISLSGFDYSNKAFCRSDSPLAKAAEGPIPGTLGTADDWRGLTILVGRGTVCDADLLFMLEKLGLTEDDVNIVNSDIDKGYQAFISGSADVIFVSGTYTTMLEEDPAYTVCHTMGGMDAAMAGNIIAEGNWLAENEDTVVKYLAGALEILLWLHDEANQQQGAEWFSQVMLEEFGTETSPEAALASEKMTMFPDLSFYESLCEVQENGLTGMQNQFATFFDIQVVIGNRDASDRDTVINAVDCSYLAKAVELYKANNPQ